MILIIFYKSVKLNKAAEKSVARVDFYVLKQN